LPVRLIAHTHLESFLRRGELPATLGQAEEAGVGHLITIGTSSEDWAAYREVATQHRRLVSYTAGLHPCAVTEDWRQEVEALPPFWEATDAARRPVALGECGLDRFHLPKDDPTAAERIFGWQREAFAAQLALAARWGCPVVVHSRGAFHECVELVDGSGVEWSRVVFHCFTEGTAEMRALLRRGGYGSFTGILTYKSAETIRDAAREQGLTRLMVETDAPYLTPMPHRGKPNRPAYVRHTAEFAAQMFGVTLAELAEATSATAVRFFGLKV
jgi:TatD DNase family protein